VTNSKSRGTWDLDRRRLYLCTPDRPDLHTFVEQCIVGGVDVVQLRDKHLPDTPLLERAALLQQICADHHVPFILNDRPDLAAAIGADGVHVGQEDMAPSDARALLGEEAIIGLSTHAVDDLKAAVVESSIDYISAGPVSPTPTKPGRPGTGLGYVRQAVSAAPWSVWITGGVDPSTIPAMAAAGARHFVVVRWLTQAEDPKVRARALRQAIDEAIAETESASPGSESSER
jgi:thiamine-phosphate pyrophosphorylase